MLSSGVAHLIAYGSKPALCLNLVAIPIIMSAYSAWALNTFSKQLNIHFLFSLLRFALTTFMYSTICFFLSVLGVLITFQLLVIANFLGVAFP